MADLTPLRRLMAGANQYLEDELVFLDFYYLILDVKKQLRGSRVEVMKLVDEWSAVAELARNEWGFNKGMNESEFRQWVEAAVACDGQSADAIAAKVKTKHTLNDS